MNKNYIIDTSKLKDNVLKELMDMKAGFDNSVSLIDKIYELKCPEINMELELLRKSLVDHSSITANYIKRVNAIIRDFNDLSHEIIKKTSLIEKVNVSNIISRK
jgi:hypothetical protein